MTYCEHCGQPLAPGTAECPVCHTPNFEGCTAQQNAQSQSAPYGQQAYSQPQGDPYGQQAHNQPPPICTSVSCITRKSRSVVNTQRPSSGWGCN